METSATGKPFRYKAFFSYSRADDWVANRLHAYLQRFVTPGDIIGFHGKFGAVPKSLRPVFRDRVNLVGGGTLDDRLKEAIEQSECLIVLCSPAAAQSAFVNQEVEIFRALGRAGRIIPVIAAGEPNSGDPATECFPPALRDLQILAPDLRHIRAKGGRVIGDGELVGRLKLIAGMLGLDDLDALYRSEQRRQRRLTAIVAGVAVAFLVFGVLAAAGGWFAMVNGQKAHDNLERFFAVNGQHALAEGKPLLAMRYALAGHALSAKNSDDYRDLLADAYHSLGENQVYQNAGGAESEVAFAHDDRDVVIGGHDGVIHVWTPGSRGDAVATNFGEAIDAVAVAPDGNTVAVGGDQGGIGLLDLAAKKWILPRQDAKTAGSKTRIGDFIMSMAISGDGALMAASSHDETIRVWDARTGQAKGRITDFAVRSGFPKTLGFVPGSQLLAAGGADGVVYVIDAGTGRAVRSFAIDQDTARAAEINADAIAFSPDGKWLAAALDDGTLQVWNAATGQRAGAAFGGHSDNTLDNYNAIAFAPDSWTLATASEDHAVRLWDMSTGQPVAALHGHEDQAFSLAFAKDGRLVSSSYDGSVRLWAAPVAAPPLVAVDPDDLAQSLAVSAQTGTALITEASGLYRLQDVRSGAAIVAAQTRDAKRVVLDAPVVTMPGGKAFVRAAGGFIYFVDAKTGAQIGDPLAAGGDDISTLAVSADGRFIASASDDFAIRIWDAETRKQVGVNTTGSHALVTTALAFAPDSQTLVAGGGDNLVRVLDMSGHELRRWTANPAAEDAPLIGSPDAIRSIAISPDGRLIASGGNDYIRLWDFKTGKPVGTRLPGPRDFNFDVAFSWDGSVLFSRNADGFVRLWDVKRSSLLGQPIPNAGRAAAMSADSRTVWTVDADRRLRTTDVRRLTEHWGTLAKDACTKVLGPAGQVFRPSEMAADALLASEWDAKRNVCAKSGGWFGWWK